MDGFHAGAAAAPLNIEDWIEVGRARARTVDMDALIRAALSPVRRAEEITVDIGEAMGARAPIENEEVSLAELALELRRQGAMLHCPRDPAAPKLDLPLIVSATSSDGHHADASATAVTLFLIDYDEGEPPLALRALLLHYQIAHVWAWSARCNPAAGIHKYHVVIPLARPAELHDSLDQTRRWKRLYCYVLGLLSGAAGLPRDCDWHMANPMQPFFFGRRMTSDAPPREVELSSEGRALDVLLLAKAAGFDALYADAAVAHKQRSRRERTQIERCEAQFENSSEELRAWCLAKCELADPRARREIWGFGCADGQGRQDRIFKAKSRAEVGWALSREVARALVLIPLADSMSPPFEHDRIDSAGDGRVTEQYPLGWKFDDHLRACPQCRDKYEGLADTAAIDEPPPFTERPADEVVHNVTDPGPLEPQILLNNNGEHPTAPYGTTGLLRQAATACQYLARHAHRWGVYKRCGELVEIYSDAEGARMAPLPLITLTGVLGAISDYIKIGPSSRAARQGLVVDPPLPVVQRVACDRSWPGLPELRRISRTPLFLASGEIHAHAGYDPASGVYLDIKASIDVQCNPTPADARRSAGALLVLVSDFCFDNAQHGASVWIAGLLTRFARTAYQGQSPMFAVSANKPELGKSTLISLICVIADGAEHATAGYTENAEELEKYLFSRYRAGAGTICLDNVEKGKIVDAAPLARALTSERFESRILGVSEVAAPYTDAVIFTTGNDLKTTVEIERRTLRIDLYCMDEAAGRDVDRNLIARVLPRRGEYAAAALTILRAWHLAGRPCANDRPLPSYAPWSAVVLAAVRWLAQLMPGEFVDPLARRAPRSIEIEDRERLIALMREYLGDDPNRSIPTVALVRDLSAPSEKGTPDRSVGPLADFLKSKVDQFTVRQVGRLLTSHEGQSAGGYVLHRKNKGRCWQVDTLEIYKRKAVPC